MKTEISMEELARKIAGLMNVECDIVTEADRTRPELSEVARLMCENAKIHAAASWTPQYNLDRDYRNDRMDDQESFAL